jgi:hypothetical protein
MAGSSDANNVPQGTTLVFDSWACMADESGGFSSHLVTPNSPKPKTTSQLTNICESTDLDEKRVLLELNSDNPENVSTPTQALELPESDTNSDPEKTHFSEILRKYVADLNTIKRSKINNSELLVGIGRVSRSIKGCINLQSLPLVHLHHSRTQKC